MEEELCEIKVHIYMWKIEKYSVININGLKAKARQPKHVFATKIHFLRLKMPKQFV